MEFLYLLEDLRTPFWDRVFSALTFLGGEVVFIALAIVVFWCINKKDGYYLMAAGLGGTVISQTLKIACRVPRPWVRDPAFTIVESAREGAGGYSFPSGHSQTAVAALGGTARFAGGKWIRTVLWILAAAVCFSRMYLGVHTPADVAAGALIGILLVFGLYPLFQKDNPKIMDGIFLCLLAMSAAACFFSAHVPAGADPDNLAEFQKNSYTLLGVLAGVVVAAPIERRKIQFEPRAPWWAQVLKCLLGLSLLMGIRLALKAPLNALFGGSQIADALRYMIMVMAAILLWPLTFSWFAKGCPLRKKGGDQT